MTSVLSANRVRNSLTEALGDNSFIEAAALYGSVARGDAECHSDIDLLVLCHPGRKKVVLDFVESTLSREYRKLSVALYSHKELTFLQQACSLFLLHLQCEAKILFDHSGFLRSLLSSFQPKSSYHADFLASLSLLDPLRTRVLNSPNELHRISYVYSLFRIFGVYLLAEKGIFEFSKSRMADCLSQEQPNASQAIGVLSGLRPLNANFFSGQTPSAHQNWVEDLSSLPAYTYALSQLLNTDIPLAEKPYQEAVDDFAREVRHLRCLNYRLRTWFLLLVYDGLNLYCHRADVPTLTSFKPRSLLRMASSQSPFSVATAAKQTLEYIHDYRLKYFLCREAKIKADRASDVLRSLAREVR
jgi:predicted nucleotidyltransferase